MTIIPGGESFLPNFSIYEYLRTTIAVGKLYVILVKIPSIEEEAWGYLITRSM